MLHENNNKKTRLSYLDQVDPSKSIVTSVGISASGLNTSNYNYGMMRMSFGGKG
jgi:hypothetical protein